MGGARCERPPIALRTDQGCASAICICQVPIGPLLAGPRLASVPPNSWDAATGTVGELESPGRPRPDGLQTMFHPLLSGNPSSVRREL